MRSTESIGLEKTLKTIKSNHSPSIAVSHLHPHLVHRDVKASILHWTKSSDPVFIWSLPLWEERESRTNMEWWHLEVLLVCSSGAELALKSLLKTLSLGKD